MTTYTLNISFDKSGLDSIHAAQEKVTITKATGSTVGSSPVVWICFKPGLNNTITWQENYGLYSSNTQVQSGATISIESTADNAQIGDLRYPFNASYYFGPPITDTSAPATYSLVNHSGSTFTFGLLQQVTVNGTTTSEIINAASVPNGQNADFSPQVILNVSVSATLNNGVVVTNLSNIPYTVVYNPSATSHSITYQSLTNIFIPSSA